MTYKLNAGTVTISQDDANELKMLMADAAEAAEGDSNDTEIQALREALNQAAWMLGVQEVDDDE